MAALASSAAPGYGTENQIPDPPAWRENLNMHLICPDCKQVPPDLVEENADTICANCGMVLSERNVSYESEWRTFNSDEGKGDDPVRVGDAENELLNGDQLSTQIGGSGPVSKETRKLQRAQAMQASDKSNKALAAAYRQIDQWADKADLNGNVRQSSKLFYKRVDDAKAFKGKSLDAVLAGCIFIACRQCKTPRSFAEIFGLTSVPKKEIADTINAIESEGGIVNRETMAYEGTQSTKPKDLCARYCSMLGLDYRVEAISKSLAEKISSIESLAGRSPLSNAAACIYFASHLIGRNRSSKRISEVAGVSEATIKHAYKLLLAEKDRLIEKSWLGDQPQPYGGFGDLMNLPNS